MIGQATAHRRANAFAQALEALEDQAGESAAGDPAAGSREAAERTSGGAHAADRHADPEQAAMVALAASVSRRPRPTLDEDTKTVQRAQLIAAMEQAIADGSFAGSPRVPGQRNGGHGSHRATGLRKLGPRSRLSRRLAVGGLTVGVAAGAFGGVAAASSDALPGDTLYGLKRSMEDLKLDMAGGDASRGKVYLDMAATRMQEARRLMDRGRGGTLDDESVREVRRALAGMHQEASEGHRLLREAYVRDGSLQPMEMLNTFAAAHRQGWSDLRGKLPGQLTDVSDQVSSIFDAIDNEVAPLQPLLPPPSAASGGTPAHGGSRTGPTGGPSAGTRTGTAATPSAPSGGSTAGPDGSATAGPSPSASASSGLVGGSGSLLNPGTPTPSPTDTSSGTAVPQHESVELPPLLPGLLPGLDLTGDDTAP